MWLALMKKMLLQIRSVGVCCAHLGLTRQKVHGIAGIDPQDRRHFGGNRYYKSAVHAAVEFPDLAMLKRKGGKSASQALDGVKGLLPGVNQARILRARPGLLQSKLAVPMAKYMCKAQQERCTATGIRPSSSQGLTSPVRAAPHGLDVFLSRMPSGRLEAAVHSPTSCYSCRCAV